MMPDSGAAWASGTVRAPSVRASMAARRREEAVSRAATASILYPAARRAGPSVRARFPAPISVIVGRFARLRGIHGENNKEIGGIAKIADIAGIKTCRLLAFARPALIVKTYACVAQIE